MTPHQKKHVFFHGGMTAIFKWPKIFLGFTVFFFQATCRGPRTPSIIGFGEPLPGDSATFEFGSLKLTIPKKNTSKQNHLVEVDWPAFFMYFFTMFELRLGNIIQKESKEPPFFKWLTARVRNTISSQFL